MSETTDTQAREALELVDRLKVLLVPESPMHPIGCSTWMEEAEYIIDLAAKALQRADTDRPQAEPVGYGFIDKSGKLRFIAESEHDAHIALILSSADPDDFDIGTGVSPLFTRPYPVLEWEKQSAIMTEALEIIAGRRQCLDNLMGNRDVAIFALNRINGVKMPPSPNNQDKT